MPQLGILFDTQKLGAGFYGYTSFRILFSVLKTSDLAGCSLHHGVVDEDGRQTYCIAVETELARGLTQIRQKVKASVARGLLPPESRFLDERDLEAEQLSFVASVSDSGELYNCRSRWLLEVWDRSQTAMRPVAAAAIPVVSLATETARPQPPQAPAKPRAERVPFPLWWSHHGRRAFALMMAFCVGGAMLPLLGCGVSLCVMLSVAGAVQGVAMLWRLWAEQQVSGEHTLDETKKMLGVRNPAEICCKLESPVAQASPLLRAVKAITYHWTLTRDAAAVSAILDHQRKAEEHLLRADLEELRFVSWGVPALALCSFYAMQVFVGVTESWLEAPRLALAGGAGWMILEGLRASIRSSAERLYAEVARLSVDSWLPALEKAAPAQPVRAKAMSASA